jgi:hypothetical protein
VAAGGRPSALCRTSADRGFSYRHCVVLVQTEGFWTATCILRTSETEWRQQEGSCPITCCQRATRSLWHSLDNAIIDFSKSANQQLRHLLPLQSPVPQPTCSVRSQSQSNSSPSLVTVPESSQSPLPPLGQVMATRPLLSPQLMRLQTQAQVKTSHMPATSPSLPPPSQRPPRHPRQSPSLLGCNGEPQP